MRLQKFLFLLVVTFVFLGLESTAFATTGLWDTNTLMPAGASAVSLSIQSRTSDKRLNDAGQTESLGRLSRQSIKSPERSEETRDFAVKTSSVEWTPTWAYGLLSNWTILARLPIRVTRSNVQQSVTGTSGDQKTILSNFNERSFGRAPDASGTQESTNIGQAQVRSRHRIGGLGFENSNWTLSETVIFPTAEVSDVDFVTSTDAKAEGFGVGAGLHGDLTLGSRLEFFVASEVTHYFQDKVFVRASDGFPTQDRIARRPGLETTSKLGASLNLNRSFYFASGITQDLRSKSEYVDSPEDLQSPLGSERTALFVAAKYEAKPKRSYSDIMDQLSAELGWEPLLKGKNIEDADVFRLEVKMIY